MTTDTATRVATTTPQHDAPRPRLARRWRESTAYQMFLIPIGIVFVMLFSDPPGADVLLQPHRRLRLLQHHEVRRAGELPTGSAPTRPCWPV